MREVHKSFGATKIIRGVSLAVPRGQRHAMIGPNGAGKTTLFNLISGRLATTSGAIELNGVPVDGLPPHKISRLGLARSFQITSLFHRLSVFENLRCSLLWSRGYKYSFWHLLGRQHRGGVARKAEALEPGERKYGGVGLTLLNLVEARLDIAAQIHDAEIGPRPEDLGLPP